jgi:hypothetical protein
MTAKLMVFNLVTTAAKTWRRLKGENQLPKVVQGVRFQNGSFDNVGAFRETACHSGTPPDR